MGCAGGGAALLSAAAAGLGRGVGGRAAPCVPGPATAPLPGLLRGARPRGSGCGRAGAESVSCAPWSSAAPAGAPGTPGRRSPPPLRPFLTFCGSGVCVCVCVAGGALECEDTSLPQHRTHNPAPRTSFFQKCPNCPTGSHPGHLLRGSLSDSLGPPMHSSCLKPCTLRKPKRLGEGRWGSSLHCRFVSGCLGFIRRVYSTPIY